jgi:nucleoside 2-deoxyribosyltransferase
MPEPLPTRTVYLAGELFSAKHLAGNALLAARIDAASGGRFRCVLPQDLPQEVSAQAIRDQDLRALLGCDAAIFHYDGLELDSGTVVEYVFAKFADIPAVLLRTDFRHGGDQKEGDPWNLMNSFYPRTEIVRLNGMELYQAALAAGEASSAGAADLVIGRLAADVCAALEKVLALPPILPRELGPAVYDWLALMPGFGDIADRQRIAGLHREKVAKGLL